MLGAYESIGNHLPLLRDYEGLFGGNDYVHKILGWIYADILKFHSAALRFFTQPGKVFPLTFEPFLKDGMRVDLIVGAHIVWRQVFKSMWKDYDVTFKAILNDIKQHSDLLHQMAHALHMSQSQKDSVALGDFYSRYKNDTHELRAQIDELKMKQDQIWQAIENAEMERKLGRRREVINWIAAASMSSHHKIFCKARQCCPGSGDWILKSEQLKDWKDSDIPHNSVLWLHGIPGAGKVLSP